MTELKLLRFKIAYYALMREKFPTLEATLQIGGDGKGGDKEYYISSISHWKKENVKGIRFKHSFKAGEISLIFEKKWAQKAEEYFLKNKPIDCFIPTNNNKSEFHIRSNVKCIDPYLSFEEQKEFIILAIEEIFYLLHFAKKFYREKILNDNNL